MAYQMIHLEIAYRLLEYIPGITHPKEFILGAVAPDSVHMHPEYDVGMKVHSHMFEGCGPWGDTQDYERWIVNIKDVYFQHVKGQACTKKHDFILGMCIHCLTDYLNDLNIWRRLQKANIPPMNQDSFREAYYPEARGIDTWLYQNSSNTEIIRTLLSEAKSFDVEDLVFQSEIEKMREHLLYHQYDVAPVDISGYRFLSAQFIENFVEESVKRIAETIREW